jgi:hypothetical protein
VAAANEVANEKELLIVIGKNEVVCRGMDITAEIWIEKLFHCKSLQFLNKNIIIYKERYERQIPKN